MAEGNGESTAPVAPKEEGVKVISLVVRDQQGTEVQFKVKSHTKFEKVFSAYCEKKSIDKSQVRFLFDSHRIQGTDTPQSLEMEDGDLIDVMLVQEGGASCCSRCRCVVR